MFFIICDDFITKKYCVFRLRMTYVISTLLYSFLCRLSIVVSMWIICFSVMDFSDKQPTIIVRTVSPTAVSAPAGITSRFIRVRAPVRAVTECTSVCCCYVDCRATTRSDRCNVLSSCTMKRSLSSLNSAFSRAASYASRLSTGSSI